MKKQFLFTAGEHATAFRAFGEWMRPMPKRASVAWVLGHADVRYVLVPWAPELVDERLRNGVVRALFERQYELDAAAFQTTFGSASYGRAQLAAVVAKDLLADISTHAHEARRTLAGIEPAVSVVLKRFCKLLVKENGTVRVIDGDRQLVVQHTVSHLQRIAFLPFDAQGAQRLTPVCFTGDACRVFAAMPLVGPVPWPEGSQLSLPDAAGFDAERDASYAFALCGVL